MRSAAAHRRRLVERLEIRDARVRDAFLRVPRELFVPEAAAAEGLAAVYRDDVIVTKRDERGVPISSSSQPRIMAPMLERLALEPGLRVLEIGAGTGYNAALLATIVGPEGRVTTVDVDPELAERARRALAEGGYAARVVCADGRDGFAEEAPYDRVIATVSAPAVPVAWRDQVVDGGLVELPLQLGRAELQVVATFRRAGARLESVALLAGGFMPLRDQPREPEPAVYAGGPGGVLAQVGGPGVAALSAEEQRRLLAVALSEPRRLPLPGEPRWELGLWLALELPEERLVHAPRLGVGTVGPGGRSLAFADVGDAGATGSLLAYGEPDAAEELAELAARAGGRTLDDLALAVEFDGDEARLAHAWRG